MAHEWPRSDHPRNRRARHRLGRRPAMGDRTNGRPRRGPPSRFRVWGRKLPCTTRMAFSPSQTRRTEHRLLRAPRTDARRMPFPDRRFDSVSCFLGLQDIEIGFGGEGVRMALSEAARVLREGGALTVVDEFPFDKMDRFVESLPFETMGRAEQALDAKWSRLLAERAVELYADGWVGQTRISGSHERARIRAEVLHRMRSEMERQLAVQGYYVPFGPARMVDARKIP